MPGLFGSITDALGLTHNAQDELIQKQQKDNVDSSNRQLAGAAPAAEVGQQSLADLATVYGLDGPSQKINSYAPIGAKGSALMTPTGSGTTTGGSDLASRTASFMERFKASPIYQNMFGANIDASQKAIQRSATANGLNDSGATLKALSENAGTMSGNTLLQYVQGLSGLAGNGSGPQNQILQNANQQQNSTTDAGVAMLNSSQGGLGKLITGGIKALSGSSLFAAAPSTIY